MTKIKTRDSWGYILIGLHSSGHKNWSYPASISIVTLDFIWTFGGDGLKVLESGNLVRLYFNWHKKWTLPASISILNVWRGLIQIFGIRKSGGRLCGLQRYSNRVLSPKFQTPQSHLLLCTRHKTDVGSNGLGDSVIPQFSLIPIKVFSVPYFCFLNELPKFGELSIFFGSS